jgi:hypothetical protein
MNRILIGAAGLALIAGSANAAFIGIDIREDKNPPSAEGLAGFPGAANVRVFNLYAMFDGPGSMMQSNPNLVLNVGQNTPSVPPLQEGFGVNIEGNPNASFYRAPPLGGIPSDGVGGINADITSDNRAFWTSYVSIGVKQFGDPYYSPGVVFEVDNTGGDDDFGFHTQGTPLEDRPVRQRNNWLSGGWFNATPGNFQGRALDLGDGTFGTFLAQLTIMGLEADAEIGSMGGMTTNQFGLPAIIWDGDVLVGDLIVFTQDPAGGAIRHDIVFIPTPGALALFGLAGLAGVRRRR